MRVREIMGAPVVSVTPETRLKAVGRLLVEHRITGVPVVEAGRVVGVVSQADLVRVEQRSEDEAVRRPPLLSRLRRTFDGRRNRTAGDVMTAPAVTVGPQVSAVGAAWQMTHHDVSRLVVVEEGAPVGMVTRTDLVRAFARPDEDVRREIVEEVLPALGVAADDVEVIVESGDVVLRGEVEDELEACCLPHAVRGVLGVVAVRSQLTPRHRRQVDTVTPQF